MAMKLEAILEMDSTQFRRELSESRQALDQMTGASRRAEGEISGAASAASEASQSLGHMADNSRRAASDAESAGGDFTNFASSIKTAGLALAGLVVTDAIKEIGIYMIDSYRETERFQAVLKSATGSMEAANAQLAKLRQFAASTPYDLGQAVEGYVKLKNMGLDPSISSMTSYGNTAAAMGKDLMQMIEAVADASTFQFERLLEFGIKAEQTGDKVKFTFQGVTTQIEKNSKDIQKYLLDIGNTKFATAMADQANTLNGIISELKDNTAELAARLADSSGTAQALKVALLGVSGAMKGASADMQNVLQSPDDLVSAVSNGRVDEAISQINALTDEFKTASAARRVAIRQELLDFYRALKDQQANYAQAITSASTYRNGALGGLADEIIASDTAALVNFSAAQAAVDKAFKATGSILYPAYWDTLNAAQKPVWEIMESGASSAAAAVGGIGSAISAGAAGWLPDVIKYKDEIQKAANEFAISEKLIQAVMMQESIRAAKSRGVSPETIGSPAGAKGLMQLMPATADAVAKQLGMTGYSLFNAGDNIRLGSAYLSQQFYAFNGDIEKALAAYNAGPGAVRKYNGIPPYKETQNYVSKIVADYEKLTGESDKKAEKAERDAKREEESQKRLKKYYADGAQGILDDLDKIDEKERESQKRLKKYYADGAQGILDGLAEVGAARSAEIVALERDLARVGMSNFARYRADVTDKVSPAEADVRTMLKVKIALAELQQQAKLTKLEATLGKEAFREWSLVNRDGFTPAIAAAQVVLERQVSQVQMFRQAWDGVMQQTEESLMTLVTTGKFGFGDLVRYMLREATRLYAIKPIIDAVFGDGSMGQKGGVVGAWVGDNLGKMLGFAAGGYTGNISASAVAGVVHGQEFVVNAAATARYRPVLELMNGGHLPQVGGQVAAPASLPVGLSQVVVNLYEDATKAGKVEQATQDDQRIINVFVANIRQGGPAARVLESTYPQIRRAGI